MNDDADAKLFSSFLCATVHEGDAAQDKPKDVWFCTRDGVWIAPASTVALVASWPDPVLKRMGSLMREAHNSTVRTPTPSLSPESRASLIGKTLATCKLIEVEIERRNGQAT